jgi:hypothetical protein
MGTKGPSYSTARGGCFTFAVFVLLMLVHAALSEIVTSDRLISWEPGIPGGIPNRATIYTNLTSSATVAQINAALSACPSNQVVYLNAGTYTINGTITVPSFKKF